MPEEIKELLSVYKLRKGINLFERLLSLRIKLIIMSKSKVLKTFINSFNLIGITQSFVNPTTNKVVKNVIKIVLKLK